MKISSERLVAHGDTPKPLDIDSLVVATKRVMPDLDIRRIWFPVTLTDPVRVEGQATAWLVQERANQVLLDPYNGEVLAMERAEQASAYKRWGDMADPLHFGDFGGIPDEDSLEPVRIGAAGDGTHWILPVAPPEPETDTEGVPPGSLHFGAAIRHIPLLQCAGRDTV